MRILLDLDTERPQAAVLQLREAIGIFSYKVNDCSDIGWDDKQKFAAAASELRYMNSLKAEPKE